MWRLTFLAGSLFALLSDPEDRNGMFLRNIVNFYRTIQHHIPEDNAFLNEILILSRKEMHKFLVECTSHMPCCDSEVRLPRTCIPACSDVQVPLSTAPSSISHFHIL
jgi:hypothetical protein